MSETTVSPSNSSSLKKRLRRIGDSFTVFVTIALFYLLHSTAVVVRLEQSRPFVWTDSVLFFAPFVWGITVYMMFSALTGKTSTKGEGGCALQMWNMLNICLIMGVAKPMELERGAPYFLWVDPLTYLNKCCQLFHHI